MWRSLQTRGGSESGVGTSGVERGRKGHDGGENVLCWELKVVEIHIFDIGELAAK